MLVRNNWKIFTHFVKEHKLNFLFIFLIVLVLMSWLQATPHFLDTESFYHAKMVELSENSLALDKFTWMQASGMESSFVDQGWLYHVVLSLFVGVLPTFLVLKLMGVLFAALLIFFVYYWLTKLGGKWPAFFIAILFSSLVFVRQLNILSGEAAALFLLLLGIDCIINYRYWQLGILSIIVTLFSGNFFYLFIAAIVWVLVELAFNKVNSDKFRTRWDNIKDFILRKIGLKDKMGKQKWLVLVFSGIGIFVGVIVHPYLFNNFTSYVAQEFNNFNSSNFLTNILTILTDSGIILLLLLMGLWGIIYWEKRISKLTAYFILLSVVSVTILSFGGQGQPFFTLVTLIATSLTFKDLFENSSWIEIIRNKNARRAISIFILLLIIIFPVNNLLTINREIDNGYAIDYLRKAATWLYYNAPDNALIINSDWQDWAPLFYFNDNNNYWWGINSKSMLNKYPQTSTDFMEMVAGLGSKNIYALLKDKLRGDYVLANKLRPVFNSNLGSNIYFDLVYEDNEVWIYRAQ